MELPKNETMLVKVRPAFAKSKGCPVFFAAKALIETPKAAYLYGRGTAETRRTGVCMVCGRKLTHPVSVALGIGPECGSHFHDWDLIGGYNQENIDRITKAMLDIVVDGWFPKSVIEIDDCNDEVTVPADHPMLQTAKKASQITYQDTNRPGIKIEFPFDQEILTKVKLIPGRRFHNEGYNAKYWTAPLSVEAVETLQELEFDLDPKLLEYLDKAKVNVEDMPEIDIPGLKMELFPYQKKGVAFIEAKDGRALVGDEMLLNPWHGFSYIRKRNLL